MSRRLKAAIDADTIVVDVGFDFSDLERLIDMYVSEKPDDDGEETYGSYRHQARDQMDDFLGWLRWRLTDNSDMDQWRIMVTLMLSGALMGGGKDE